MECSLVNIDKIDSNVLQDAIENKTKVTIVGNLQSIHFSSGAIQKAFDKEEAYNSIVELLEEDCNFNEFECYDDVMTIIEQVKATK